MTDEKAQLLLNERTRKRIVLEEALKNLSKPGLNRTVVVTLTLAVLALTSFALWEFRADIKSSPRALVYILGGAVVYIVVVLGLGALLRSMLRARFERQLLSTSLAAKSEQLQETLEENFFTNLVKINFKYIDKYYLQTQLQADKSFSLCALAAVASLGMILIGIALLFFDKTRTEPGYVAAASGALGEFIAAVFFYLYNRTITKMGEYHQKLVLTQTISLALKISEDLPADQKVASQVKLIEYLSKDINTFLVGARVPSEKET